MKLFSMGFRNEINWLFWYVFDLFATEFTDQQYRKWSKYNFIIFRRFTIEKISSRFVVNYNGRMGVCDTQSLFLS